MARLSGAAGIAVLLLLTGNSLAGQPLAAGEKPFNSRERVEYYIHRTYGWHRFTTLAFEKAFDHATDGSRRWDRGPCGYAFRYANAFSQRLVSNSLELGLSAALREDARYRPSGLPRFRDRIRYAATHAFLATRDDGSTHLAYSRLGAMAGGLAITSNWDPDGLSLEGVGVGVAMGILDQLENALTAEFSTDLKQFGRKVEHKILRRH